MPIDSGETLLLPFLRERVEAVAGDVKSIYTSVLFENLLTAPWTAETEEEAFAVLRRLSTYDDAWEELSTELPAYRLIDAMLANRIAAAETQTATIRVDSTK